ncbi:unnamed protein product, partial [marine sediment metagenome]
TEFLVIPFVVNSKRLRAGVWLMLRPPTHQYGTM